MTDEDGAAPGLDELCWHEKPRSWPRPLYCRRLDGHAGRHDYASQKATEQREQRA